MSIFENTDDYKKVLSYMDEVERNSSRNSVTPIELKLQFGIDDVQLEKITKRMEYLDLLKIHRSEGVVTGYSATAYGETWFAKKGKASEFMKSY